MKRKRIGAGQRGSSDPFLTAKELLKASKNTRNISQYFAKKETVETIQTEPQEQESTSTASAETASVSQLAETNQCLDTEGAETQDVILVERKCEVVTIDDGDDKNEEEQTHETTTLDLKPENNEPSEDGRSGPDHHIFIFILIQLFL